MSKIYLIIVSELHLNFYVKTDLDLSLNSSILFKNEDGTLFGKVSRVCSELLDYDESLFCDFVKVCDEKDLNIVKKNLELSNKALFDAKEISSNLELDMNFVDSYFYFDKSQLIFSFISDNRVDFRELAKKLAQKYKTRIELRQIGVRDKAKKVGGLGPCGLFLCCNSFLNDFNSVSINMAKNQMLALNPSKINGICGRLLCCLSYENDIYSEAKEGLPKLGSFVEYQNYKGKVVSLNILKHTFSIDLGDRGIIEIDGNEFNNGKN